MHHTQTRSYASCPVAGNGGACASPENYQVTTQWFHSGGALAKSYLVDEIKPGGQEWETFCAADLLGLLVQFQ